METITYHLSINNLAVRDAMEIDIQNHVIILDEAHNIEDVSRDSGSIEVIDEEFESKLRERESDVKKVLITLLPLHRYPRTARAHDFHQSKT
jgi:Rad3-related DNA helicase